MHRVRRNTPEVRVEMAPLIDVVFLLLTFFVFAMLLMVRAQVLDIALPTFGAGDPARGSLAIVVKVDAAGGVFVDGEPVERAELAASVRNRLEAQPDAVIRLAADEGGQTGDLLAVIDTLASEGLGNFQLFGSPLDPAPGEP